MKAEQRIRIETAVSIILERLNRLGGDIDASDLNIVLFEDAEGIISGLKEHGVEHMGGLRFHRRSQLVDDLV